MGRSDGRNNPHVHESKPPGARPQAPAGEERPAVPEGRDLAWRAASLVWAVVFLFLVALLIFDMVFSLLHR
jgi:hypothetical protein